MAYKSESKGEQDVLERTSTATKPPPLYTVLLHNDDYTPMDFVVMILETVFAKPEIEAVTIMLDVHRRGVGIAGIYPHAIAETKVARVHELGNREAHPLRCSMEPA